MTDSRTVEPPRAAAWLVDLFAPRARAEAILGDLREEFGSIARRDGGRSARAWFWRQSRRTAAALAWEPFRSTPAATLAWGFAGLVLAIALGAVWNFVATAAVVRYPVYAVIPAAAFWRVGDAVPWLVAGAILAFLWKDRSISVSLAAFVSLVLLLVSGVMRPVLTFLTTPGREYHSQLAPSLIGILQHPWLFSAVMLLGAAIGRKGSSRVDSVQFRLYSD